MRSAALLLAAVVAISAGAITPMSPAQQTQLAQPAKSLRLSGYADADSVARRISERGPELFEGLWTFPDIGGVIAIERAGDVYRLVVVEAPERMLPAGTLLGSIRPGAKRGQGEASVYSRMKDAVTLSAPRPYRVSLEDEDSRLVFKTIDKGTKINIWRLLPWRLRGVVRQVDESPVDLNGLVRIFPFPSLPLNPVYL